MNKEVKMWEYNLAHVWSSIKSKDKSCSLPPTPREEGKVKIGTEKPKGQGGKSSTRVDKKGSRGHKVPQTFFDVLEGGKT